MRMLKEYNIDMPESTTTYKSILNITKTNIVIKFSGLSMKKKTQRIPLSNLEKHPFSKNGWKYEIVEM